MALSHTLTGGHNPPQRFGPVRVLLILAQLVTACGFFIALGGLSKLQKTANGLGGVVSALPAAQQAALVSLYSATFTEAGVPPYPTNHKQQFAFIWYLLFLELAILVWIAVICLLPSMVLRMKASAGYLLTYVFVLFTLVVQSLVFFHKNDAAKQVFGSKAINTTMAGVIIVLVCNGITLIMLGLIGTGAEFIAPVGAGAGATHDVGAKKVGPDVAEGPTHQAV